MNCVGVDALKGKSTVVVIRLGGEVVIPTYDASHTVSELSALIERLKSLDGETYVDRIYGKLPCANGLVAP